MKNRIFTSEAVTEGHPDKICDQISDAILDDIIARDPMARVACETCCTTGLVMVMGEITTNVYCDVQKIVRKVVDEIGYNRGKYGFDAENLAVISSINEQSHDIAMGVDKEGAGDQGMMFGYACSETDEYMPLPIYLAQKLARRLTYIRKNRLANGLRPDGKTQVSVEYDENGKPKRIPVIVVSTQHDENLHLEEIEHIIKELVIKDVIPSELMDDETQIFVNPTGQFITGGPKGDTGLTGRKIIVDTYGGYARHGGGAFSGKDPTKVDRSAAYMMRHIAKNIVASGLAEQIEIQISYAIGVKEPTSLCVDTFGTSKLSDEQLIAIIKKHFVLQPKEIIDYLDLRKPIYRQVSAYGHFGRNDLNLPWERLNKVEELKQYLK